MQPNISTERQYSKVLNMPSIKYGHILLLASFMLSVHPLTIMLSTGVSSLLYLVHPPPTLS